MVIGLIEAGLTGEVKYIDLLAYAGIVLVSGGPVAMALAALVAAGPSTTPHPADRAALAAGAGSASIAFSVVAQERVAMPSFHHHGAEIYYEEFGQGFPILTFAPAGLKSTIAVWGQPMAPINPATEWAADYRVIVMDQRNAGGRSRAPLAADDGWDAYTADHLALLDHLQIDRCHLYGQCIGGSFIINILKKRPERVAAAVLAQPIGRVGPLPAQRSPRFDEWAAELKDHPEATPAVLDRFYHNLYDPGFVYCADRDFVKTIKAPCLILAGNDEAHPWPISEELSKLLPNSEFVPEWKTGAALTAAKARVKEFLARQTPPRG